MLSNTKGKRWHLLAQAGSLWRMIAAFEKLDTRTWKHQHLASLLEHSRTVSLPRTAACHPSCRHAQSACTDVPQPRAKRVPPPCTAARWWMRMVGCHTQWWSRPSPRGLKLVHRCSTVFWEQQYQCVQMLSGHNITATRSSSTLIIFQADG